MKEGTEGIQIIFVHEWNDSPAGPIAECICEEPVFLQKVMALWDVTNQWPAEIWRGICPECGAWLIGARDR